MLIWPLPSVRARASSTAALDNEVPYVESRINPAAERLAPSPISNKGRVDAPTPDLVIAALESPLARMSAPSPATVSASAPRAGAFVARRFEPPVAASFPRAERMISGPENNEPGLSRVMLVARVSTTMPVAVVRRAPPTSRLSMPQEESCSPRRFRAAGSCVPEPPKMRIFPPALMSARAPLPPGAGAAVTFPSRLMVPVVPKER